MPLIFLAIALMPGIIAYWSSRKLEKLKDDPALPELLFARRSRVLTATYFAMVVTSFAEGGAWYRAVLFVLSIATPFAGGYPLARKLFGHTISLPGYVWSGFKTLVASLGVWIALLYLPILARSFDEPWRLAALLLVPLMIAWSWWFVPAWLKLNGARPLTSPELNARIDEVARRASVRPPALYVYGADRMKVANAVALRGPRPAIALGNGLVELLSPEEVAAIYAHEIAHIEQIPPREMRTWRLALWGLILAGFAGLYLADEHLPASISALFAMVWPFVVLGMLLLQGRRSQRHETESDLRAAELTGDPELVARALVKIHVHSMIPRRWAIDFEKSASHPSLARRIQALRGTTPSVAAPAFATPAFIQTARASRVVAFDDKRAYWFDGVPEGTQHELGALREHASGMRAASWNDLVELRIAADSEEDRVLVATHKSGETWSVPIARPDVAAVQKLLDSVDTRLHGGAGLQKRSTLSPRVLLSLAALVTLVGSPGLLLFPIILALFRPSTAMLAGVAGLMAVNAVFRFSGTLMEFWSLFYPIITMMLVISLLTTARHRAKHEKRDGVQFTVVILGLGAMLMLVATVASGDTGLAAIAKAPSLVGFAGCLVGIGAAVLVAGRRSVRMGGIASLVAGLAAVTLGIASPLTPGGSVSTETARVREVRRVDFPAIIATGLQVSPDGRGILIEAPDRDETRTRTAEWQLRYDDSLRTMPAIAAGFVDSARMLSLWESGDSLELRLERLDSAAVEWRMPLPRLRNAKLTTHPIDRSWAVVGEAPASDSFVVVSGSFDQTNSHTLRLARIDSMMPRIFFAGPQGRSVIGLRMSTRGKASLVTALASRHEFSAEMWESSERGIRRIGSVDGFPMCGASGAEALRCITITGAQTTYWRFAGDSLERETALASGEYFRTNLGTNGLVTMLKYDGSEVQFGDPMTGKLLSATIPQEGGGISAAVAAPGRLWTAVRVGEKVSVIEYRIEREP